MSERSERLRLAFVGLHPDRRRALVARTGSAAAALSALRSGRVRASDTIKRRASLSTEACRQQLAELGVAAWFRGDPVYPAWLADHPHAPDVLFGRGELAPAPGVAIVGTRRCTRYGRSLARSYGRIAAEEGWPVISGLARGIDGEAHSGTVQAGGIGVAVLGSGSDVVYPPEHRELHDDLLEAGGAVVTEYPPGTPPEGWRFPPRNQIIAGLARAVVVVEAARTGGALITATIAAERGLMVFAVPGDIDRPSSAGCNLLIRDGAIPVLTPDDFADSISLVLGARSGRGTTAAASELGSDGPLLAALGTGGLTLEEAAVAWGVDAAAAAAAATRLELDGAATWAEGRLTATNR